MDVKKLVGVDARSECRQLARTKMLLIGFGMHVSGAVVFWIVSACVCFGFGFELSRFMFLYGVKRAWLPKYVYAQPKANIAKKQHNCTCYTLTWGDQM